MRHASTGTTYEGSRSLWMRRSLPKFPSSLTGETRTDVCVVGAGISGLTTAFRCLMNGHRVVVVEAGRIGGGETLRTAAHLASAVDDRFVELERMHGPRVARKIAESHAYAIDWIESLCAAKGIDCGFERVPGYLFAGPRSPHGLLARELAAARRARLEASFVDAPSFSAFAPGPCIRFAAQAQLDPAAYLAALARLVVDAGGSIHEGCVVARVEEGAPVRIVLADGCEIAAAHVVVATNAPICSPSALPSKQAAYRSYVITLEVEPGEVPLGLYWDSDDPYHHMRVVPAASRPRGPSASGSRATDLLLVGGEDHRTGQEPEPESCFARLERWASARFPDAALGVDRWSRQILEPADGIGFVGRNPGTDSNVYVISGDSGNGLTLGTLGARIVADLIDRRSNPWARIYDPSRSMLPAAGTLIRDRLNATMQYLDRVGTVDVLALEEIPEGAGAVMRAGSKLLAVYRDEAGTAHACSALCTHRGAVVHWNDLERSWDCPCHGSRFDAFGAAMFGPAVRDLPKHPLVIPEPAPKRIEEAPAAELPFDVLLRS